TAGGITSCTGLYPFASNGYAFAGIASQDITSLNGVTPVQNHSSPGTNDILLGRINNFGYVQWYTMLGAALNQNASIIVADADDNLYFGGGSNGNVASIGSVFPLLPYNSGTDPMFGKLNASGQLLIYGFIGTASNKQATGINIDRNGNLLFGMGSPDIASLAGVTPSHAFNGGTDDMAFFEFDTNFGLRTYAFVGDANSDYDPRFAPVYNGGFLVTGNTIGPLNSVNGRTTKNAHGSPASLEDWFIARFLSVKDL
ncbi:MAG: hypothetical protein KDK27_17400, partial [Leptospiraceae bacterium]|nr:hypothetical protein [Leptospiraceae bacterium]